MKQTFLSFPIILALFLIIPVNSYSADDNPEDISFSSTTFCIINPPEGAQLPYVESSFVYGTADPSGILVINGSTVPVHPGRGFLTMVDYSTGTFLIQAQLKLSTTTLSITREVTVRPPVTASQVKPLVIDYVKPDVFMELRAGDIVTVKCKGSPDAVGYFTISGIGGKFPLKEVSSPVKGIYYGSYTISAKDRLRKAKIRVTLEQKKGRKKITCTAPGRLSRMREDIQKTAEVTNQFAVIRSGPAVYPGEKAGYMIQIPAGILLEVTGRIGSEYRIRLSDSKDGWISANEVKVLSKGTPPPHAYIYTINTEYNYPNTRIQASCDRPVPFEVKPSDNGRTIDVLFYGAVSNTDWIKYDSSATAVKHITWAQTDKTTYKLHILLQPDAWWGYDAYYENTIFNLELRRPAGRDIKTPVLKDITVALDAGHSPDNGAIGPTGTLEKDINMAITTFLEKKLLDAQANVLMVREENEEIGLYARIQRALDADADIYISIHNNALPEGKNPFEKNGYGVYYYHAHSIPLAKAMHKAYGEVFRKNRISLRNDGMYYGNLAVIRTQQIPAVLTESAYMIVPEQEALLKTENFQRLCAEAMFTGIKNYVKSMREIIK